MKPKNEKQRRIVELSATLPPMTEKQMAYATKHCFSHKAVKRSKGYYCTHCGGVMKSAEKKCPHCGYRLEPIETRTRKIRDYDYYGIVARCQEYQVIRIFMVHVNISVGDKAQYSAYEVIQQWIDAKGTCTYMAILRGMGYYLDKWSYGSRLEIRNRNQYGAYDPNPILYPYMSVIPEIRRNGFKGNFHGITPNTFFCSILSSNRIECLLKMGQIELLREAVKSASLFDYWQSILICQRHGYIVNDGENWHDMMCLLKRIGKDTHSPKFIMPADIKAAHDHWLRKVQFVEKKEKLERELKEAVQKEDAFREMKGKFFGVAVTDNEITIRVLESVREHIIEGTELHHCVGHGNYAMRSNSLILSATVNGERMETIEINLDTMTIQQCRGLQNQPSAYHDRIVNLMKHNIHLIVKAASQDKEIKERMSA